MVQRTVKKKKPGLIQDIGKYVVADTPAQRLRNEAIATVGASYALSFEIWLKGLFRKADRTSVTKF
jgi:hypothetical protein